MSAQFNHERFFDSPDGSGVRPPSIKVPEGNGILDGLSDEKHTRLLNYLLSRLSSANQNRGIRLRRYANIDRAVSTWQKLSAADAKRQAEESETGRSQAIPANLPIIASHLEDTVSFFSEVFAPQRRNFFIAPEDENPEAAQELAKKMNRDTKSRGYYAEVCKGLRALCKYNIGGVAVRWEEGGGQGELSQPGNRIESIDMYNYLWDPTVKDPSRIHTDAEFAARISEKNQLWAIRAGLNGALARINKVIGVNERNPSDRTNDQSKAARFFKNPPTNVGLTFDGTESGEAGKKMDWDAYGAGIGSDMGEPIKGLEVIEMYCWLNPFEFDLESESADDSGEGEKKQSLNLYRFVIIDAKNICSAVKIEGTQNSDGQITVHIPHYLAFMTQDDMKEAQRSVSEMIRPFQRFSSFLMNIYMAGARKNIWGMKGVDPTMFDTSSLDQGDVAGVLKSKVPGRDVRTGMMTLDSSTGTEQAMGMLQQVLAVMKELYPSQALPSQIAGMDRAIKSQVSAVLQGSQRRMHMMARILDSSLFGPMRLQCYRNLAAGDGEGLNGITEEAVATILGSGLHSLNAEASAELLKEIIFAVIQNQEGMQYFDVPKLFQLWSLLMNLPFDLSSAVRQQIPAGPEGTTQPTESEGQGTAGAIEQLMQGVV